jgi:ATP-dependent helicase HrpB
VQPDLPIYALDDDLRRAWRDHNRLVVIAPTGSGKTTQVCQMLLADGGRHMAGKRIVVLQPRRVAARSVARRVAEEVGVELGAQVGYQVRFDERLSDATQIAFVTEGILLRWLHSDPGLSNVGAVLFDEFHERNLLSDLALAVCKQLQAQSRPDLLLVVMSATLEAQPIARYLGDCPVLESAGRSFPVEMHYQSWGDDGPVWERAAAQTLSVLRDTAEGDILVFMPGMAEIQRTIEEIRRGWRERGAKGAPPALLALHGEMPPREQDRAFAPTPSGQRRVIVATNVAETSITLPNIRAVVDSGLARVARYDPERGVNTLHIEPISQASADQRAGRAGRTAPGVCYRLWSQAQHAARPLKNTPEIQRTELSSAVLLIHSLGVRDAAAFDFPDKPDAARMQAAEALLQSLGAVVDGELTDVGRRMLRIPVHPRYARMLIEAERHGPGCVRDVALLAALVSGRDLLVRLGREDRVQKRNREGLIKKGQKTSDLFLLAHAFDFAVKANFDGKACYTYGIHAHAAREVALAFDQLLDVCAEVGLLPESDDGAQAVSDSVRNEAIRRCHLVGFMDHLAVRTSSGSDEYDLAGGRRCRLMDESVVGSHMLVVASELREITTRSGEKLNLIGFGSAVELAWVREINPLGLNEQMEHVYDRLNKRVVAGRILRYHDLLIGGERVEDLDPHQAAWVLAGEFADALNKLPQWPQLKPLLARRSDLTRDDVVQRLARAWHGATTYKDAIARDVLAAFAAEL